MSIPTKSYGINYRNDAERQLTEALEVKHLEDAAADYDTDNILTECYDAVGCWDISAVDDDLFWDIVRNNARW